MTSFNSKRITFFLGLFLLLSSTNASGDSEIAATFTAFADISVIPAGESDSDFAIPPESSLSFSLAFSPETIGPGSVSTLTYTLTNETDSLIENLEFSNTLPVGMTIASPVNASSICGQLGVLTASEGGDEISFSDGSLGAGQSCTITVNVTAPTAGVYTNPTISLNYGPPEFEQFVMSTAADLTVVATLPGFSKSFAPSSVPLGGKSTLTLTIDNSANASNVLNFDFTDNLPPGMVIADPPNASTTCGTATIPPTLTADAGSSVITLDADGTAGFPAVGEGDICTVMVDVEAIGAGTLTNITEDLTVVIGSTTKFIGKASAALDVTVTPLAIEKTFLDDPTPPGDSVLLEFKLLNFDRSFEATGVAFTDSLTKLSPLLPGLLFSSVASNDCGGSISGIGTPFMELSGGTIAAEGSCTCKVWLSIPASATPGAYTNTTGTVTGTVDGSPVVGNMASDDLYITSDPIFRKEFINDPVGAGNSTTLRFTIQNINPFSSLSNLSFTDDLNSAIIGLAANGLVIGEMENPMNDVCGMGSQITVLDPDDISLGMGTFVLPADPTMLVFKGGKLNAFGTSGDGCVFDVIVDVPEGTTTGTYTNVTSELNGQNDAMPETISVSPASADLLIVGAPNFSKEFIDNPVIPGGTTSLRFTIDHPAEAPDSATSISFTDDLTTVLSDLMATSSTFTCNGALVDISTPTMIDISGGKLAPGESCEIEIALSVPPAAIAGSYLNQTSNLSAMVGGLTIMGNQATDDLDISGLKFSKEFLNNPVIAGDTSTLRFTIENVHPTQGASIISFSDDLDAGLSGLAATGTPSMNTCGGSLTGTTNLSYLGDGGSLIPGQSCIIDVPILAPAAAADGTYRNTTSSLSADQGGPVSINPATDVLMVQSSLIGLKKEFTQDLIAPGDTAILKFTLTNLDPLRPIDSLGFTDNLDAMISSATFEGGVSNTCGGMASGNGTFEYDYPGISIAAGDSCEIHIKVAIPSATAQGIYTNTTSEVKGTIAGLAVNGPAASDDIEVVQLLDFTKSFDGPSTATGRPKLTFTITNPGTNAVSDLRFSDDLDAVLSGLEATGLPMSDVCGNGSSLTGTSFLELTGASLEANGGSCTFAVDLQVPATASAGTYTNTSSPLTRNGLELAEPAIADLTIEPAPTFTKVFAPDESVPGDMTTLTFTIDNMASSLAATSLNFTDNLPAGVTIATPSNVSTTCTGGTITATPGSSVISYTSGTIGATSTCTVQADVTAIAVGAYINTSGDLTSSSGNSGTATDTWNIICGPGYSSSISGTTVLCLNDSPDPLVTFTFTGGVAPYTFTYNIDGGVNQMVSTTMGDSVTVSHPTTADGVFTYNFLAAKDSNGCPGPTSGSAVITVYPLPTAAIAGTVTVCEGDADPDITFTGADGTAPYTFTYTVDGGANQTITTTVGNSVTLAHSTATPGMTTYALVSVEDAKTCSQTQADSAIITVNPLPTATIAGTVTVCEGDADPDITFTGADGTAPYTFTYTVDGGGNQTITTTVGNSVTLAHSTATPSSFTYALVSVEDANTCNQVQAGSAIITVNQLPTATIAGTVTVCEGDADPDVTFTGADGTAPYTFTYTVDGGANQTITTTVGNSVTLAHSTATPGMTTYALVSVEDDNMCNQGQSGNAEITVDPILGETGSIIGITTTCPGIMSLDYEIASVDNATSYTWSFSDPSVIINDNGTSRVTLDNVTTAGTLSLIVSNNCETSEPITFDIEIASPEVCVLAECSRNSIFIDDELLAIVNQTDIFRAIDRVESSATILDTWTKTFKAGDNIELFRGFTVEEGAIFIAEIESCVAQFKEAIGK